MPLSEILIQERFEAITDTFKTSKYMSPPKWNISIEEGPVEWWEQYCEIIREENERKNRETAEIQRKRIQKLFRSAKYRDALSQIDEFLSLIPYDEKVTEIKNTISAALELQEKIKQSKSVSNYMEIQKYVNELYQLNDNTGHVKNEKEFLDEAIIYLDGSILTRCKNKKNYRDALAQVSELTAAAPSFYKNQLEETNRILKENQREHDRLESLNQLNQKIEAALTVDNYAETLPYIKEAQVYLKNHDEIIFNKDNHEQALSITRHIDENIKNKNYTDTLALFKNLEKLNPYSAAVREQVKLFENYISIKQFITTETSPYKLYKKINSIPSKMKDLPEYLTRDLNTRVIETYPILETEKDRLRKIASTALKKEKYDDWIETQEKVKSIELDQDKVRRIEEKIQEIDFIKRRRKRIKQFKYVATAVIIIFLIYFVTGPVPYYFNKSKVNDYLVEARMLMEAGKFEELKAKLNTIFQLRKKLDVEQDIDFRIISILTQSFSELALQTENFRKKGKADNAIQNAETTLHFFTGFPGEASERLREKSETGLKKLKHEKYFKLGQKYYRSKKYGPALKNLEVAKENIASQEVLNLLKSAKYEKHKKAGMNYYNKKNYIKALAEFTTAKKNKSTPHIKNLIVKVKTDAKIQELTQQFTHFKKSKDTENAFRTLIELKKHRKQYYHPFNLLHQVAYMNSYGCPEIVLAKTKFIFVKGGTFDMGCFNSNDTAVIEDAVPVHTVTLSDFWISKTEAVKSRYRGTGSNVPVNNIEWKSAQSYARNFGKKFSLQSDLPTEAQWEYTARNRGKNITFPWGNSHSTTNANYKISGNRLMPVGSFPANKLGLVDLAGNLREWCRDVYYDKFYSFSKKKDPCCTFSGNERVVRGGSYNESDFALKTYVRYARDKSSKDQYTGFRIVLENNIR